MAKGKTQEDVFAAANALLLRGERPTVEKVRAYLGGGSPNTITPHLDAFYKHMAARLAGKPVADLSVDMPIPVVRAAEAIWKQAQQEAQAEYARRLESGLAGAHEARDAALAKATALMDALNHAEGRVAQLSSALEARKLAFEDLQAQLARITEALEAERRTSTSLREQLLAASQETSEVRAQCQADIERANERSDAAANRAALLIESERTARANAEKAARDLRRQLEALDESKRQGEVAAAERAGRLEGECAALKDTVRTLEAELARVTSELSTASAELRQATKVAMAQPKARSGTSTKRRTAQKKG